MKTRIALLAFLALAACKKDRSRPQIQHPSPPPPVSILKADFFEEPDQSRSYSYHPSGALARVDMDVRLKNGRLSGRQDFVYDNEGKLTGMTTDNGWRMAYTLSAGRIIRTDEYVNGSLSQYHTFQYDGSDRLTESTTWQDIPEEGGEIPVAKDTYQYDGNSNLAVHRMFYYTRFGADAVLLTTITFGHYDTKINSEGYFELMPANPLVSFSRNNPGQMQVHGRGNQLASTETYNYEYHARGYASKRSTLVRYPDGSSHSYSSTYRFRE